MKTAIALSGGGARGSFEVGAVRCLYTIFGIRPQLLTTCSVGSINGVKLAEGKTPDEQLQAMRELEQIWFRLNNTNDMYVRRQWLQDLFDSPLGIQIELALRAPERSTSGSFLDNPLGAMGALLVLAHTSPGAIAALSRGVKTPSLFLISPMEEKLRNTANLDPERVANGTELRMATTSLESGALRYVTGDGSFLERDNTTAVVSAVPSEIARCQSEANAYSDLQMQISALVDARDATSDIKQQLELNNQIRKLRGRVDTAFSSLQECLVQAGPKVTAKVDLVSGVMASSAMPAIFEPVPLGLETYVDGGVREIIPVQIALQMGATEVFAIVASSQSLLNKGSFAKKGFLDVILQSLVEVTLKEITRDDLTPPNVTGVPIHVIAPSFDVHDTTEIDPALIDISMDYGFMRAGDVVFTSPTFDRSRATELSDVISTLRRDTWDREVLFDQFNDPRDRHRQHSIFREIRVCKWLLKRLVAARQALHGPTPPNAFQWHGSWERMRPGQIRNAGRTPWEELTSITETTPAESPTTFVPDQWLLQEKGSDKLYALLKGAIFSIPDEPTIHSIQYDGAEVIQVPDHTLSSLPLVPMGETLLREAGHPPIWYCNGSRRYIIDTPAVQESLGLAGAPLRLVPEGGLAQIPVGGAIFWTGGLVVTDSALAVLGVYSPTPQLDGSNSTTDCYLYNRTATPITVSSFKVDGDSTNAFSVLTALPLTIFPGVREMVKLRFQPSQPGNLDATLVIDSDDSILPRLYVPLSTSVIPRGPHGKLRVTPENLAFLDSVVGKQNKLGITVENIGDAEAGLTDLSLINEVPPGQFQVSSILPDLHVGESKTIPIAHMPTQIGDARATAVLKMQGDATYSETFTIDLTGTAKSPMIALNPPMLDFGAVLPGTAKTMPFQIVNSGNAPLTVNSIFIVLSGKAFFFDPSLTTPFTIAPMSSQEIHLTYTASPTPGQADNGEYEIVSDDPDHPNIRLVVRGLASGARIDVRPDYIDFHTVPPGPAQLDVTVQNNGSSDLLISRIAFENGVNFLLVGVSSRPIIVVAGAHLVFQVQLHTATPGLYQDRLIVESNDARRGKVLNSIHALVP